MHICLSHGAAGVRWQEEAGKWEAYLEDTALGLDMSLGLFVEQEDAARVHDEKAREHLGERAVLNFSHNEDPLPAPTPPSLRPHPDEAPRGFSRRALQTPPPVDPPPIGHSPVEFTATPAPQATSAFEVYRGMWLWAIWVPMLGETRRPA
jgi:hypothetical protein